MIGHQPLELLAGILAATVRVVQQGAGLSPSQIAITRASVTSWAVMLALIDQTGDEDNPSNVRGITAR